MFLSGRDYPVRPEADFRALLAKKPSHSVMAFEDMTLPGSQFPNIPSEWCSLDLYARLPFDLERRLGRLIRRIPPRSVPRGLTPYRGSAFSCFTREAASYLVTQLRSRENRDPIRYFKTIRIPDEITFPTLICNSQVASRVAGWPTSPGTCGPLHYIDWSPRRENPAVLDETDLAAIVASERYFVRKVSTGKSALLLNELDARLLGGRT